MTSDVCSDSIPLQIVECVVISIGLFVVSSMAVIGCRQLHYTEKGKRISSTIKYIFHSCIILAIIKFILVTLSVSLCHYKILSNQWSFFITISSFIIYGVFMAHLFLCWLARLYLAFNQSAFAKKK
eukprot:361832_1